MAERHVRLEFPTDTAAAVDEAVARYEQHRQIAEVLGGAVTVWKRTEGWVDYRFPTDAAAARFQAIAVPLPPGWGLRVG